MSFVAPAWTGKMSCTFEAVNLCDWRNLDIVGDLYLPWTIANGSLPEPQTPGGRFAIAASTATSGTTARLLSASLPSGGSSFQLQVFFRTLPHYCLMTENQ